MGGGFGGGHMGGGFGGGRMAGMGHDHFGRGRFGGGDFDNYGIACPYYESNVSPYTCDY
jgi:hypothetical protein